MNNHQIAAAFIAQYPVMPGHPGMDHVALTSADLDKFAAAHGIYPTGSAPEMNTWRNDMVGKINAAGQSKKWLNHNGIGFQLVVTLKSSKMATEWMIKPIEVAAAHTVFKLPERNRKTIVNRVLKVDKMLSRVDKTKLPKEERKAVTQFQDALVAKAQLEISMANNEATLLQKTLKMLEKVDPKHRMLPK